MKFVTEIELKTTYRQSPFTVFELGAETRLTPEARQFLIDRQIVIQQGLNTKKVEQPVDQQVVVVCQKVSSFLWLSFSLLLERDIKLAEQVMKWQERLAQIQGAYETGEVMSWTDSETIVAQEITAFHIQLPQGRELAILNGIRASLAELQLLISNKASPEDQRLKQMAGLVMTICGDLQNTICELMEGR